MNRSGRARCNNLRALLTFAALTAFTVQAQPSAEVRLQQAGDLIRAFTDASGDSIPTELFERSRGIAVIPNVFRGGFILGARRGTGVFSLRMDDGSWSNPAFITLTGGSIGWQIGAEATDIVLVFANENAVKNIASGKFTLGGEASAVAGPLRRQASSTMTFRAEVYGYQRSRGLYAGAAFLGARLRIDHDFGAKFYEDYSGVEPLGPQSAATPSDARRFLLALDQAAIAQTRPFADGTESNSEAQTFPLAE